MQFTTIALALSSYGLTLGAAVDSLTVTPGIAIHVPGTPVATTLNISQVAGPVERSVEKRGNGNFYVCTDKNFGGICQNLAFTTDVCYTLASPFQDSISSAGPDSYACSVYQKSREPSEVNVVCLKIVNLVCIKLNALAGLGIIPPLSCRWL
ncbi:hypothetical protein HBI40_147680 [Parastagonospora nodorum]|nr:hypothetical protein HBI40_147680 [Parastagonospora nodorum]